MAYTKLDFEMVKIAPTAESVAHPPRHGVFFLASPPFAHHTDFPSAVRCSKCWGVSREWKPCPVGYATTVATSFQRLCWVASRSKQFNVSWYCHCTISSDRLHCGGIRLDLCSCRLSASPATGLVGMQENIFLDNYFRCMGFLPLTCRR